MILAATLAAVAAGIANMLLVFVIADRFGHEGTPAGIAGAEPAAA